MQGNISLLYRCNDKQIALSLYNLKWFMMYAYLVEGQYTYTIEDNQKYIVLHCPETGDMCHLVNHPTIVRAMQDYDIRPHQYTMFDE